MQRKSLALALIAFCALTPAFAERAGPAAGHDDLGQVVPALRTYTDTALADLWRRPDLGTRDRSIVTVAALISQGRSDDLQPYLERALDNGVKPPELSEIITHLAFYAGWPSALSAVPVTKRVFEARGIGTAQLTSGPQEPLSIDGEADRKRAAGVEKAYGDVSPSVVQYTNGVLFNDLWRRPGLSPRDRSLVTVSALIAGGHAEQLSFHLNRAMDNGLTRAEVAEVITHLAFYAGWPNALSAVPVARAVFEKRRS